MKSNLFVSTKVTKELKIGKLSPKWRHLKRQKNNLFDHVLSFQICSAIFSCCGAIATEHECYCCSVGTSQAVFIQNGFPSLLLSLIDLVRNKWSIPIWTTPSCIYHIVTALWRGPSENPVAAARPVTRTRLRESLPKLK